MCFSASCKDYCGGAAPSGCKCDYTCHDSGNCCDDFKEQCPAEFALDSCEGHCGGVAPSGCQCDATCQGSGDCCHDFKTECPVEFAAGSTFVHFKFPILKK